MSKVIILGTTSESLSFAREMRSRGVLPVIIETLGWMRWPIFHGNHPISVLGQLHHNQLVFQVYFVRGEICSLHTINNITGELSLFMGEYFYTCSSVKLPETKASLNPFVPL